jgi:NAD(P) transhydrogenase subunit alpha
MKRQELDSGFRRNDEKKINVAALDGVAKMIDGFLALYLFMLAAFTGHEIISRVPVILHTPLMSGSNFVHGIVLVGAMVALGEATTPLEQIIGFIGVFLGAGNAAGGYVVTERMLEMFKSSKKPAEGAK